MDEAGIDENWVLSFISGYQDFLVFIDKENFTIITDANGILGWIDNDCLSHPTESIGIAADE